MINDLPNVVQDAGCLLFADDLKLFLKVETLQDCLHLQQDINRVHEWSVANKLYFNINKCNIMSCSRALCPLQYGYTLDGEEILRVNSVRDLGVTVSSDLTFRAHILAICKKAFQSLGFILRQSKDFRNPKAVKGLYNALVRSRLETASIIWNPHEVKYSLMLEKIQNKFLRYLYLKEYGVYPFYPLMYPTLFVLGMVGYYKLEVRRNLALAKYVFLVMRGQAHNPQVLAALPLVIPNARLRREPRAKLLAVPVARTNIVAHAPLTTAIRILNAVSQEIDLFHCSLTGFTEVTLKYLCKI